MSSVIVVTYRGTDITNHVNLAGCSFESQINALPGTFEMTLRDTAQTLDLVPGGELTVEVDGVLLYGGYCLQIERGFYLPVDDTTGGTSSVKTRQWIMRGVDYNILFDKRVLRNTADYLHRIPAQSASQFDGALIETLLANYVDMPAGFDLSGGIEDVWQAPAVPFYYNQQGDTLRQQFEFFRTNSGAVYYITPDKVVRYRNLENVEARWGFSDQPNNSAITGASGYQNATIGFREITAVEDASYIVNDALVWGGSPFAGTSGGTVFARAQDATSQSTYERWQLAETHFGEEHFLTQATVSDRADVIVNGAPGSVSGEPARGLRFTQWNIELTWFGDRVPTISGVPDHLYPGDLVHIVMDVFAEELVLPMRQVRMTFPSNAATGETYVQFRGSFSLQLDDPYSLWKFLLHEKLISKNFNVAVPVVTDGDTESFYGAYGSFSADITPAADGAATVFNLPFGYIKGTLDVWVNGSLKVRGTDFTESDSEAGEFTFGTAPPAAAVLVATARMLTS